jgi:hypothetical protein
MIALLKPVYVARRQNDGAWSIVDIKSGRVADIGRCILRRLDARMAAALVQDLKGSGPVVWQHLFRDQVNRYCFQTCLENSYRQAGTSRRKAARRNSAMGRVL